MGRVSVHRVEGTSHCLPNRIDTTAGVHAHFIDLAVSDSRLYCAFSLVDHAQSTWEVWESPSH